MPGHERLFILRIKMTDHLIKIITMNLKGAIFKASGFFVRSIKGDAGNVIATFIKIAPRRLMHGLLRAARQAMRDNNDLLCQLP
ncbi:MAG: hypothetical protein JWO78_940 [Micavibrio sp.]|nr:hypothetical protein [Micavibrio sp.]